MTRQSLSAWLSVCIAGLAMLDHPVLEEMLPKELFRSEIRKGVSLIIRRGAMIPADELEMLGPPPAPDLEAGGGRLIGYFAFDAILASDSGELLVWSRVQPVVYVGQWDSYEVLDVLALPDGRMVVALVGGFSLIEVVEMSLVGPSRRAVLPSHEWSQLAAALPHKPGRLTAELSYDDQRGTVRLIVVDRAGTPAASTQFDQTRDLWEFSSIN